MFSVGRISAWLPCKSVPALRHTPVLRLMPDLRAQAAESTSTFVYLVASPGAVGTESVSALSRQYGVESIQSLKMKRKPKSLPLGVVIRISVLKGSLRFPITHSFSFLQMMRAAWMSLKGRGPFSERQQRAALGATKGQLLP